MVGLHLYQKYYSYIVLTRFRS